MQAVAKQATRALWSSAATRGTALQVTRRLLVSTVALHTDSISPPRRASRIDEAIKQDHAGILDTYAKFNSSKVDAEHERQELAWVLIRDLTIHALAEEEVVYPVIRNKLGKGARDHALDEHTALKKLLVQLDGMRLQDDLAAYCRLLQEAIVELKHHVQEEEDKLLPELVAALSPEENAALARRFEDVKPNLPTRPHILAPDKPITGNVPLNRATAPFDRARDYVRWDHEKPPSTVERKDE